jgi:hypothetical protein
MRRLLVVLALVSFVGLIPGVAWAQAGNYGAKADALTGDDGTTAVTEEWIHVFPDDTARSRCQATNFGNGIDDPSITAIVNVCSMVFKDTVGGTTLGVYGSLDGQVECDGLAVGDTCLAVSQTDEDFATQCADNPDGFLKYTSRIDVTFASGDTQSTATSGKAGCSDVFG